MINVLIDKYTGCNGIFEGQRAEMGSRSQEDITEEVMSQNHLGECRVQQVEKKAPALLFCWFVLIFFLLFPSILPPACFSCFSGVFPEALQGQGAGCKFSKATSCTAPGYPLQCGPSVEPGNPAAVEDTGR